MIKGWYKIYAGKITRSCEFHATINEFAAWFHANKSRIIEINLVYDAEKDEGMYTYTKNEGWKKWELPF